MPSTLPRERLSPESTADRDGYVHPYVVDASVDRTAVRLLGRAMAQISHAGTPEQKARAAEHYNELRRKLYAILAEE